MLKPQSPASKIDSVHGKIGHICCGQKMKDVEGSGGNGSQKPLISEPNSSFEQSFPGQFPIRQALGGSECFHPGSFGSGWIGG